jgi:NADH-quinone oxidoreductase subunit M
MSALLTITWVLPLAGAAATVFLPRGGGGAIRGLALAVAVANLAVIALLSVLFALNPPVADPGSTVTALAFVTDTAWLPALNVRYHVGVDAISLLMMFLAAVVALCGTLASWNIGDRVKEFFILLQVLAAGVFGCFISFDLFTFFVFNELTLIPTWLLIAMFGSGRKSFAAMKLTLILMGGSALILVGIFGLYFEAGIGSFGILELSQVRFAPEFQMWAFPVLFLGFAILGNIFPFHLWSPDGHASAPTAVSMFLAGVHMKLGAYGCLRVGMYLLPEGAAAWMDVFLVLAAAGVVWGAFVAVRQTDLKYMNAYSSVSHCGLVFVGLAAMNAIGLRGAVMQMLAHGFITAAVFAGIGMIYHRTRTRMIPEMSGLMRVYPFLSVSFVIAGLAALGLPGLAGFAAEINVFLGAFAVSGPLWRIASVAAVLSIVVTAVYVLRAVGGVLYGPVLTPPPASGTRTPEQGGDATGVEKAALLILLAAIVGLGVWPGPVIDLIDGALHPILNNLNR